MTPIERKYSELGAQLHGRAPIPTSVPLPPPTIPKPAVPTAQMTVQGIDLAPAARLGALAAVRDQHRARARMASDKMHAIREQISERELRIKLVAERATPGFEIEVEAQVAVLESEISQLRAAQMTAQAEAAEAGEAAGEADRLFKSALKFCDERGITVSVIFAGERR
ncbi:hypothetical protein H9N28_07155 [Rhodobacter capsulatus]|uniref:Uncharacterized protein n=1 Tax=Rhodobacter capsulatus TaxID=1061 RepID=A0A0Q0QXS9_RHOCA|nr:hypothetical protein [Rhodobacter capsulatus]KQB17108.1 hypothetical protein AP073_00225 [Rhodobacter capsulatus]KQB17506.1 hypothetical protein AP071_00230 [Rhodobacter capsulatus]PZX27521.1 hypothetical protein LY44_00897 [Rhodobacter capsulatus]QNR64592.1 hypothetical protein H9N28_07155 [Rhodobacter capsulatus]WER07608.1 hypothetical protein PUH89_09605 [Rhodobacter capsulatus]